MFNGCTGLLSLPDGFTVPEGIKSITAAFRNCSSLRTLPSKFTIPEGVTNTTELFNGCSSLQSLPEGFSFPSSLRWINKMFYGCNNLRILPSTLSLKDLNADANRLLKEAFYVSEGEPLATYYPGDAAEVTPGDGYWETQNRTLVTKTDDLPAGVKVVHFKTASLTTPGQWDDYATVLTDESGKLTQPGDPQAFGYPFKGWYTSEACMTKFDFGKQIIADDVVVYGAFGAPILRGTVPLEANVVVDASGGATTASAEIRSFTPVDIDLTSIACETVPGIAELFPDEADRTKPFVTVQFPDQAEPVKAPFTGQPAATSVTVPLSTGWTSPGTKSCDISLDLNGANMRHRIEGHSANVANIVWTIKVKE